jgi:hypothetical protein
MKALNKIDVMSVYNEEWGGFGPLRAPKTYPKRFPSVETNENNEILFIDKIKRAARLGVRSNAGGAFDLTPACVRRFGAFDHKSITATCVFERRRLSLHVLHSTTDSMFDRR